MSRHNMGYRREESNLEALDDVYVYRVGGLEPFLFKEIYYAFGKMGKRDKQQDLLVYLR